MVQEKLGIGTDELEDQIVEKIRYMLTLYTRFRRNFKDRAALLTSGEMFTWGEEKELVLIGINEEKLYRFIGEFTKSLKGLTRKITPALLD